MWSCFLDLEKWFDSINTNILSDKLKYLDIGTISLDWFQNYSNGRSTLHPNQNCNIFADDTILYLFGSLEQRTGYANIYWGCDVTMQMSNGGSWESNADISYSYKTHQSTEFETTPCPFKSKRNWMIHQNQLSLYSNPPKVRLDLDQIDCNRPLPACLGTINNTHNIWWSNQEPPIYSLDRVQNQLSDDGKLRKITL